MSRRMEVAEAFALGTMAVRFLTRVRPCGAREARAWRRRAASIPDSRLRAAALDALEYKRYQLDGAALIATLVRGFNPRLVRLLVAYQVLCEFLDVISEWPGPRQVESGLLLHRALAEALNPRAQLSDHYALHSRRDDGGYLLALVDACRVAAASLPAFDRVRSRAVDQACRLKVQALNHDCAASRRTAALVRWAERHGASESDALWFEVSGAASTSLSVNMLLALAADRSTTPDDIARATAAYVPWVGAVGAMLDSLADRDLDHARGEHSYVSYYDDDRHIAERLVVLTRRARKQVLELRHGERHAALLAGVVAMYLTEPGAYAPDLRETRRSILSAAGPSVWPVLAIMRIWRGMRRLRAALASLGNDRADRRPLG